MPNSPNFTSGTESKDALRRIAQLEATLMRRTMLLQQAQAELSALKSSRIHGIASVVQRLLDRVVPPHSRRRAALRSGARAGARLTRGVLAGRIRPDGPPPEARHLSECTPPSEYRQWIYRFEPGAAELAAQRQHRFPLSPVVSVGVPVFDPPPHYLEALIRSVREQTYAKWELCCANASNSDAVRTILSRHAAQDSRIKVVDLESNQGIAGNTRAAIALATGAYLAFADHDDVLAPFALHEVVAALNRTPDADFFYSDEDKLNSAGERVEPHFKPDWSPETLLARNYVCHLTVLSRDLYDRIGGLRDGFDGAQDHDLVLRAGAEAKRVVHIPQVLYHWRMHAQSTASVQSSKTYAFEAGKRAVADHLARSGIDAVVVDGARLGVYQPIYRLRTQPLVTVIVLNRDHPELLRGCTDSLAAASYANYELVIVENGSTDPATFELYAKLRAQPNVRIVEWDKPFNYAAANNFAAGQARGELLLFLNNDISSIGPEWLEALVTVAVRPGVGAVGAKLFYADDTVQHAGIVLGMGGVAGHGHLNYPRMAAGHMQRLLYMQNVAAVTGACLLTRRTVFEQVGGFDEGFVLAFNDVDLCLQILEAGYRVVWTPAAELYHLESKTRGYEDTPEKQARFQREVQLFHAKWGAVLAAGDPYYSPHFRLDRPDFALKSR